MLKLIKKYKYICIFFVLGFFIIFNIYSFGPILKNKPKNSGRIIIYDRNGEILTHKSLPGGYYKKYNENLNIKNHFINSLILQEDKRYFSHFGIDFISKIRSIFLNIKNDKILTGGSTITEQYIKNKYFLGYKRTYFQKIKEAYLAFLFNLYYKKEDILYNYLDNIYFGNQIYGISGAIEVYFNKTKIEYLNENEIKILLGIIKNPSLANKFPKKPNIDKYPLITNRIINNNFKREIIYKTTISKNLQDYSFEILNNTIDELNKKNVTNGALIAFNPNNGEILAYHGSKNFYDKNIDGQVDVITKKRQLGSTFKPFLYLLALENGIEIDELIIDIENKYNIDNSKQIYYTQNYSLKEYGLVRFKKALGNSLNNASVRLGFELGLEKVYDFYVKYGFEFNNIPNFYGLGLVLGNPSITLENLIISYSHLIPYFDIDQNFELTFDINKNYKRKKIQIDKNKFLLYQILSDPDNRDISFGVNSILNTPIFQAVKTGTSSNFVDNVIVSYHSDMIVGIWVGNNDNSGMLGVTGITGAGYIYNQFIKKAIQDGYIRDIDFEIPKGITKYNYCLDYNCYRKEISYTKGTKKLKSKILENYYNINDIFEKLDEYEKNRLNELGFEIDMKN